MWYHKQSGGSHSQCEWGVREQSGVSLTQGWYCGITKHSGGSLSQCGHCGITKPNDDSLNQCGKCGIKKHSSGSHSHFEYSSTSVSEAVETMGVYESQ